MAVLGSYILKEIKSTKMSTCSMLLKTRILTTFDNDKFN